MCTVTWILEKNGYQIFFNRDELKTRRMALPPQVAIRRGVQYIAPTDADAGGTWLAVNEFGLSVGMLNYYHPEAGNALPGKEYISRGLLLKSLIDSATRAEAIRRLQREDPGNYRSFILVIWEPGKTVAACTYDGSYRPAMVEENPAIPLTSSSFSTGKVIEKRRSLFREMASSLPQIDARSLTAFHQSHLPGAGPYSVCMHREDAQTVSFSRVIVTAQKVEFLYAPGSPCRKSFLPPVSLPRIPNRTEYERTHRA